MYALFCILVFRFHRANWHSLTTLTEVFPCSFLSCKAMCTVLLPPGVDPIAVNKYIISYQDVDSLMYSSGVSYEYIGYRVFHLPSHQSTAVL